MATFVLVHGAWQGGWCWSRVAPLLRAAGHDVIAPTLTGLGDRSHLLSPQVGLDTHVQDVVATLVHERRDDVVLVGHSYAGQVIAGVGTRCPDAIRRLVYLDAFVPEDGDRGVDLLPDTVAAHWRHSVEERGFGWLVPPRSLEVLGVTNPADVAWLQPLLGPHPWRTYTDRVAVSAASLRLPAAFVECTEWMRVFQGQAERAAARGWPVHELPAGHEAMVTAAGALTEVLVEIAA